MLRTTEHSNAWNGFSSSEQYCPTALCTVVTTKGHCSASAKPKCPYVPKSSSLLLRTALNPSKVVRLQNSRTASPTRPVPLPWLLHTSNTKWPVSPVPTSQYWGHRASVLSMPCKLATTYLPTSHASSVLGSTSPSSPPPPRPLLPPGPLLLPSSASLPHKLEISANTSGAATAHSPLFNRFFEQNSSACQKSSPCGHLSGVNHPVQAGFLSSSNSFSNNSCRTKSHTSLSVTTTSLPITVTVLSTCDELQYSWLRVSLKLLTAWQCWLRFCFRCAHVEFRNEAKPP
mmetsp:Transcript_25124/g.50401  ORF Transcript_25124/g.50401 Transcript_25124/m.50401 type:complete len:287 (-) Transcript_25124:159-1019(-)